MLPFTKKNKGRALGASLAILSVIGPTVANAQANDSTTRELAQCYSSVMNAAQNETAFKEDYGRIMGQLDDLSSFSNERFSEIFNIVNNPTNYSNEVITNAIRDLDNWIEKEIFSSNYSMSQEIIEKNMRDEGLSDAEIHSRMDELRVADEAVYNAFKKYRDTLAKHCETSHK